MGNRGLRALAIAALLIAAAAAIGTGAYNAGLAQGLAEAGRATAVPGTPYVYMWPRPWGFGFGFFPLLFVLFLFFGLRGLFWRGHRCRHRARGHGTTLRALLQRSRVARCGTGAGHRQRARGGTWRRDPRVERAGARHRHDIHAAARGRGLSQRRVGSVGFTESSGGSGSLISRWFFTSEPSTTLRRSSRPCSVTSGASTAG